MSDPQLAADQATVVQLLGNGFCFSHPEDGKLALEWAVKAYRHGIATATPPRTDWPQFARDYLAVEEGRARYTMDGEGNVHVVPVEAGQ